MTRLRSCFVGDSLTLGVGDSSGLGWVGRVCESWRRRGVDVTGYNLGIRRDTSADIRARWREETARRLPDGTPGRLVLAFGTNDCLDEGNLRRVRLEDSLAHARSILGEARQRYEVWMMGPPPTADETENERLEQLSVEFGRICEELAVPFLDTHRALRTSRTWREELAAGDGYHPGAAGYAAFAQLVGGWPGWS